MSNAGLQLEALPGLTSLAHHILGTKYAFVVLFTVNVYDYILSLPDEIHYMWRWNFSLVSYLYVACRYYALAVFCVTFAAYFSPLFTPSICGRFLNFFPYAAWLPLTLSADMVVCLRVYALYRNDKRVWAVLVFYLVAEFSTATWLYTSTSGHGLLVPVEFHEIDSLRSEVNFLSGLGKFISANTSEVCIYQAADSLGTVKPAILPLMQPFYNTMVFGFMIRQTIVDKHYPADKNTLRRIMASQSITCYMVISSSFLLWALMIIFAPPALKYSTSMPTLLLFTMMVNKMTLNLRKVGSTDYEAETQLPTLKFSNGETYEATDSSLSSTRV